MRVDLNTLTLRQKFNLLRLQLKRECLEREHHIDALLALYICKNHGILLGPPGTGKTYLIELICNAMRGGKFWSILAAPTSKPDEFFGPVSINALKDYEIYQRNTENRLPTATIAYVDEIFKADIDILNTLLKLINERIFYNPDPEKVPLRTLVASSNEIPEDDAAGALIDRFIWKSWIGYIRDEDNWLTLMERKIDRHKPNITVKIWEHEIEAAAQSANQVTIKPVLPILWQIKEKLESKGFVISDRKWGMMLDFMQAYAWIQEKSSVDLDVIQDLLPDCVWNKPEDMPVVMMLVHDQIREFRHGLQQIDDNIDNICHAWINRNTRLNKHELNALALDTIAAINSLQQDLEKLYPIHGNSQRFCEVAQNAVDAIKQIKSDIGSNRQQALEDYQSWLDRLDYFITDIEQINIMPMTVIEKKNHLVKIAQGIHDHGQAAKDSTGFFEHLTIDEKTSAIAKVRQAIADAREQVKNLAVVEAM